MAKNKLRLIDNIRKKGDFYRNQSLSYALGKAFTTAPIFQPELFLKRSDRIGLPASSYKAYIASKHWKRFKRSIEAKRGKRCELCGNASDYLDLHHLNYRRLGCELPSDVRLLCRDCHEAAHAGFT